MKVKLGLFLLGFSFFYAWMNISWVLPVTWLQYQRGLYWNIRDYLLWILPALLPYLILLKFYNRSKLLSLLLIITGIILSHFFRSRLVYGEVLYWQYYYSKNAHLIFSSSLFGAVWYFVQAAQYYTIRNKELLFKVRSIELGFLQEQMNPHFLFNSLNNCYGLVYEQSPKALQSIRCLSKLMKYCYRDFHSLIPIQEELDHIREYIVMQQLRYEQDIQIRWETSGPLDKIKIQPLLFIPFIENAFKHGDVKSGGLNIFCSTDGHDLLFHCSNRKGANKKNEHSGIGLNNVQRRLELVYPNEHRLQILNEEETFKITLAIYG